LAVAFIDNNLSKTTLRFRVLHWAWWSFRKSERATIRRTIAGKHDSGEVESPWQATWRRTASIPYSMLDVRKKGWGGRFVSWSLSPKIRSTDLSRSCGAGTSV